MRKPTFKWLTLTTILSLMGFSLFSFAQPYFGTDQTAEPNDTSTAPPNRVMSTDQFNQTIKALNNQTQNKLNQQVNKQLSTPPPAPPTATPTTPTQNGQSEPTQQAPTTPSKPAVPEETQMPKKLPAPVPQGTKPAPTLPTPPPSSITSPPPAKPSDQSQPYTGFGAGDTSNTEPNNKPSSDSQGWGVKY